MPLKRLFGDAKWTVGCPLSAALLSLGPAPRPAFDGEWRVKRDEGKQSTDDDGDGAGRAGLRGGGSDFARG